MCEQEDIAEFEFEARAKGFELEMLKFRSKNNLKRAVFSTQNSNIYIFNLPGYHPRNYPYSVMHLVGSPLKILNLM